MNWQLLGSLVSVTLLTTFVLASVQKRHFLTFSFSNNQGESEIIILELAEGYVRNTIPIN
jgi:hypothetical protein